MMEPLKITITKSELIGIIENRLRYVDIITPKNFEKVRRNMQLIREAFDCLEREVLQAIAAAEQAAAEKAASLKPVNQ